MKKPCHFDRRGRKRAALSSGSGDTQFGAAKSSSLRNTSRLCAWSTRFVFPHKRFSSQAFINQTAT
jgi:hypothetical protein